MAAAILTAFIIIWTRTNGDRFLGTKENIGCNRTNNAGQQTDNTAVIGVQSADKCSYRYASSWLDLDRWIILVGEKPTTNQRLDSCQA